MQINQAALKAIRAKRELSMRELAALVDTSPSYISNLETGHRNPSEATVKRLAKALRVRPATLTGPICPACGQDTRAPAALEPVS